MIKKTHLAIAAVTIVGATSLLAVTKEIQKNRGKTPAAVTVMDVKEGDAESDVMAEGVIVPSIVANISVLPSFEAQVKQVFVNNGSHVTKGQVLAELDPIEAQDLVGEAQADTRQMEAQYRLALVPHRPEDIEHAKADLDRWQAHYDLIRTPHRPEEIEQMEAKLDGDRQTITEAQAGLQLLQNGNRAQQIAEAADGAENMKTKLGLAENNAQRNKVLYDKELISKVDWEQTQADLALAKTDLAAAQERYSLAKEGYRPEEIQAAQAILDRAKSTYVEDQEQYKILKEGSRPEALIEAGAYLKQAKLNYKVMLEGSRAETIQAAAAQYQKSRLAAQHQTSLFEHRMVRSPITGIVIARNINPGEVAAPNPSHTDSVTPLSINAGSMFVIEDESAVEFQASVDQRYFTSLSVGQAATVQIESLPGRSFEGKIVRMNRLINPDTVGRIDSYNVTSPTAPLTFSVWVRVANPQRLLVPGQVGLIRVSKRQSGLTIPQIALSSYALGEGVVYVERNGVVHKRSIKYDGSTDGAIRVLSGLEAGDRVVVSDPTGLADGMEVHTVASGSDADFTGH